MANISKRGLFIVGHSIPRVDAISKATGKAKFAADFKFPGACHARLLMSPYPHARIISIDVSKAEHLPGVRKIVTGHDPLNKVQGGVYSDQPIIARDVVRHVGETVAAMIADSEEIAEEALQLIDVVYEELPAVFDIEEAIKPDCSTVIHPDLLKYSREQMKVPWRPCYENRPNVYQYWEGIEGNVEKGFIEADVIVENKFSTPRAHHACPETHHVDVWPEPDGGITIRAKNKAAFSLKSHIVQLFGIPSAKVRIIIPYVGTDYGSSGGPYPQTLAAMLALSSGRPIRLAFDRWENFVATPHKPAQIICIRDGVKKDGSIVAREVTSITDAGAYTAASNIVTYVDAIASAAVGLYKFTNFRYRSYGVYTNLPPSSAFRGIGQPDLNWALESQMDIVAHTIGMDPAELRKKHILKEGEITCLGQITHSIGARECLDKVTAKLDWGKQPTDSGPKSLKRGKGIGLACQSTPTGPPASVDIRIQSDGTVEVHHAAVEQGQGTDTVMTQIAAEAFKIPVEKIRIVPKDTAIVPPGPRTGGSRCTFFFGNATWKACLDAKLKLFELAAPFLGVTAVSLETKDGRIYVAQDPDKSIDINKVFSLLGPKSAIGEIIGSGEQSIRSFPVDGNTGHSARSVASYGYGAYCIQVAVDTETGDVKIEKIAGCFDMGQPINPQMCEQQIEGAIGMGIGIALYEEIHLDKGVTLNPSFMDYNLTTTAEIPSISNITPMIAAAPHTEGPFGAKGMGESVLTPFYAAVGNAVYSATGVRIKDLPLTKEKVYKALRENEGDRSLY